MGSLVKARGDQRERNCSSIDASELLAMVASLAGARLESAIFAAKLVQPCLAPDYEFFR